MNIPRLRALSTRLRAYDGYFTLWYWSRCACGVACNMPEFKMVGLKAGACDFPTFKDKTGWDAIMAFFELSETQATHLFSIEGYGSMDQTANVVADRIDALIDFGIVFVWPCRHDQHHCGSVEPVVRVEYPYTAEACT